MQKPDYVKRAQTCVALAVVSLLIALVLTYSSAFPSGPPPSPLYQTPPPYYPTPTPYYPTPTPYPTWTPYPSDPGWTPYPSPTYTPPPSNGPHFLYLSMYPTQGSTRDQYSGIVTSDVANIDVPVAYNTNFEPTYWKPTIVPVDYVVTVHIDENCSGGFTTSLPYSGTWAFTAHYGAVSSNVVFVYVSGGDIL